MFFSFFSLFKMRCLSLNLLSLQTVVRERVRSWRVFALWSLILWHLSIFTSPSISDLSVVIFWIFFSQASKVPLGSYFVPSIWGLILRDLYFNSIKFADTLSEFKISSSMALTFVFKSFIYCFTWNSSSSFSV